MKDNKPNSYDRDQTNKPLDAYHAIKELIFRRILNPGQKLPYGDLSKMIGMSKTPITNALNRLAYEGFVVYEMNRGYRIKPIDEGEISHLFEIRMELECLNVRNAIHKFSPEGYARLRERYETLAGYNPDFTERRKLRMDMAFHLEIGRMGGNSYSTVFLNTVIEHILFRYRLERGIENRKALIGTEHLEIFGGIGARDEGRAIRYMRQHIEELHKLMLQHLKELNEEKEALWSYR